MKTDMERELDKARAAFSADIEASRTGHAESEKWMRGRLEAVDLVEGPGYAGARGFTVAEAAVPSLSPLIVLFKPPTGL